MNINIVDFKKIVNFVLDKCILSNGFEIETEEDNFWFIDTADGIDFSQNPNNICVGSLIDDYKSLQTLISGERDVNILDLDRVANVIKFISLEIERDDNKHL